uniref:Putative ovule protein n=1 Tax=Solanum chacoense TaxID=4108 RepID=A0A0V0HIV9_SOLCH
MEIVNKVRLFGETFPDSRVVEKMMISLPARFESKISAIEESCDLKTLSVAELISKLQAQEQRSSIRDEEVAEAAFQAQHKGKQPMKDNRRMEGDKLEKGNQGRNLQREGSFHLAATVKEPFIKKKTFGSKESHRFSVDYVERWVILRKLQGQAESTTTKPCAAGKFC